MNAIRQTPIATTWMIGVLVLIGAPTLAAPPIVTDLVVSPTALNLDDPQNVVAISVDVVDLDGDLDPRKVKAVVKLSNGMREKLVLQDVGNDRFSGEFIVDTSISQDIAVKVRAKDFAGEKARSSIQIISVHDCGNAMGNGNAIIDGPSGPDGPDHDSVFRSLTVHPLDSDIVLIGTERNGFVKSEDGGQSWRRLRSGLRHTEADSGAVYPEIWDIAIDPHAPSRVYAATLDSPGPVTGNFPSTHAGIYLSDDGGETWRRSNCGLSNSRTTSVKVDRLDPNTVVIGVESGNASFSSLQGQPFDGGLYRSTDRGAHWSRAVLDDEDDRHNGYWHLVSTKKGPPQFITFGLWSFQNAEQDGSGNMGFLRSRDSGQTWEPFGDPVKDLTIVHFHVSADGDIIYANPRDSFEIQRSTDAGETWTATLLNQANGPVTVSPADPNRVLYAGTATLTLSTDGLESTQVVLEAEAPIHDVVFAPSDPHIVYVATEGYLIYKSMDAGHSFSLMENIRSNVLNQ